MVEVWKLDLVRSVKWIAETLPELTKAAKELTEEIRLLRMAIESFEAKNKTDPEFGLDGLER